MSGAVVVLPGRLAATMGGCGSYIVLKCSCSVVMAAANRSGVSPKISACGLLAVQVSRIASALHSVVRISSCVLLSIFCRPFWVWFCRLAFSGLAACDLFLFFSIFQGCKVLFGGFHGFKISDITRPYNKLRFALSHSGEVYRLLAGVLFDVIAVFVGFYGVCFHLLFFLSFCWISKNFPIFGFYNRVVLLVDAVKDAFNSAGVFSLFAVKLYFD